MFEHNTTRPLCIQMQPVDRDERQQYLEIQSEKVFVQVVPYDMKFFHPKQPSELPETTVYYTYILVQHYFLLCIVSRPFRFICVEDESSTHPWLAAFVPFHICLCHSLSSKGARIHASFIDSQKYPGERQFLSMSLGAPPARHLFW